MADPTGITTASPDRTNGRHDDVTVVLDPRVTTSAAIEAGERLAAGQLVALPTETVYGLGASIDHPEAVAAIFTAKGRPTTDPLIVHIAQRTQLDDVAVVPTAIADLVDTLTEAYWPGPLTLILPRRPDVTELVGGGRSTVGVRLPAHADARTAIAAAGAPVAAPSANRFGRISPTTAAHVLAELDGRIAAVLDGGPCPVGLESTVLDLCGLSNDGSTASGPPRMLRPGAITLEEIRSVCPDVIADQLASTSSPESPGQRLRHYAPDHTTVLVNAELIDATRERCVELGHPARVVGAGPAEQVGPRLYDELRSADSDRHTSVILLVEPHGPGIAAAILDRMWRAAEGRRISSTADLGRLDAWIMPTGQRNEEGRP